MTQQKMQIVVEAINLASAELKEITRDMEKMGKGAQKQTDTFAKFGMAMLGVNQAIALVQQGIQVLKKAWDFALQGAQLERLSNSARTMAASFGQDMDKIVSAIQEASNETIAASDAMAAATKALQLGVATTPEEFNQLTKAAIALGGAMGRGPVEAMNDIVTGIGRMSPLILDNLGIVTSGGKVFDDYAATLGKTAKDLTDTEKKQALVNITIRDGSKLLDKHGNVVKDTATEYEKLGKRIQEGGDAAKNVVARALEPLIKSLNQQLDANDAMTAALDDTIISVDEFIQLSADMASGNRTNAEILVYLENKTKAWQQSVVDAVAEIDPALLKVAESADRALLTFLGLEKATVPLEEMAEDALDLRDALSGMPQTLKFDLEVTDEMGDLLDMIQGRGLGAGGISDLAARLQIMAEDPAAEEIVKGLAGEVAAISAALQVTTDEQTFYEAKAALAEALEIPRSEAGTMLQGWVDAIEEDGKVAVDNFVQSANESLTGFDIGIGEIMSGEIDIALTASENLKAYYDNKIPKAVKDHLIPTFDDFIAKGINPAVWGVSTIEEKLKGLDGTVVDIIINYIAQGNAPSSGGGQTGGTRGYGGSFLAGEHGPELVVPMGGGLFSVLPATKTAKLANMFGGHFVSQLINGGGGGGGSYDQEADIALLQSLKGGGGSSIITATKPSTSGGGTKSTAASAVASTSGQTTGQSVQQAVQAVQQVTQAAVSTIAAVEAVADEVSSSAYQAAAAAQAQTAQLAEIAELLRQQGTIHDQAEVMRDAVQFADIE